MISLHDLVTYSTQVGLLMYYSITPDTALTGGIRGSVSGYYLSFTTRVHVLVKLSYLTGG